MAIQRLGRDTTSVDGLTWDGGSFGNATADSMWMQLAEPLRQIARAELGAGNSPTHILFNETSGIILLAFTRPPITIQPASSIVRVHTTFANGNYCYDGTFCTYEDIGTGCFLAFDDPDRVEDR